MVTSAIAFLGLATLLVGSCIADFRSRRIPNKLVLLGIVAGLLFQALAPAGEGFAHATQAGALGLKSGALGILVALALLLPIYAMRALGAGDVKLVAMVGAWLGPQGVFWTIVWTGAAGGAMALVAMLWLGRSSAVVQNLKTMWALTSMKLVTMSGISVGQPAKTHGRLPYAFAITAGTAIELIRQWVSTS